MQAGCNNQYPAFGYVATVLDRQNAYSWRCAQRWDNTHGLSINEQCAAQYGRGAYAGLRDSRNPYSWFCQR